MSLFRPIQNVSPRYWQLLVAAVTSDRKAQLTGEPETSSIGSPTKTANEPAELPLTAAGGGALARNDDIGGECV